jgi:acetyl esterase/lipase
VVIVHGGSWDNGRKGTPGTIVLAKALARHGYVAFDINYRLSGAGGEYPRNIRDVDDAVAYLTTHRRGLRIDPDKIAVVGISSGGYLALMAAYRQGVAPFIAPHYRGVKIHIRAVGSFFSPVELKSSIHAAGDRPWVQKLATYMGGSTYDEDPDRYTMASPLRYADTGVPTIFWYAGSDPVTPVRATFELYKRLRQRQMQSQLLDLPRASRHLTDLAPQSRKTAFTQLLGFLDDVLNHTPSGSR